MECSIQRGGAELNGTFQLSTNEHIRTIARMKNIHYLFYIIVDQPNTKKSSRKNLDGIVC